MNSYYGNYFLISHIWNSAIPPWRKVAYSLIANIINGIQTAETTRAGCWKGRSRLTCANINRDIHISTHILCAPRGRVNSPLISRDENVGRSTGLVGGQLLKRCCVTVDLAKALPLSVVNVWTASLLRYPKYVPERKGFVCFRSEGRNWRFTYYQDMATLLVVFGKCFICGLIIQNTIRIRLIRFSLSTQPQTHKL